MRVASYNIHDGIGMDGVFRLDRIAEVISASGADLIGLQEVPRYIRKASAVDSIRILAEATGMYGAYAPSYTLSSFAPIGSESGRGLEWPQYGNGFLSRYPIRWTEVHPLPYFETRGAYIERRGILEALIAGPSGSNDFLVLVSHFGLDPREREQQAEELVARIERTSRPIVLMGDFNALPDSEPINIIKRALHLIPPKEAPGWTFPVPSPDRQLDYIFVRGFEIEENFITINSEASDHLAVTAKIRLG